MEIVKKRIHLDSQAVGVYVSYLPVLHLFLCADVFFSLFTLLRFDFLFELGNLFLGIL